MAIEQFVLSHEPALRLSVFVAMFALVALWELAAPRRALTVSKALRWGSNLGLAMLNAVLLRLIFPLAAVGVAAFCAANGWGLLNHFEPPFWLAVPMAVIAMDFVIWLQHVMVHAVPTLWRLHQVHHADLDYDLTTGSRFHPIEIALSMVIKLATITALGPPVLAVVTFEILLNATAMFNHGNIQLPAGVDRVLRWFIVTPDMHRVHHSTDNAEANSNFGFNLAIWDRLFGTYRPAARLPQESMEIGVTGLSDDPRCISLTGMLAIPFVNSGEGYAIGHGGAAGHEAR